MYHSVNGALQLGVQGSVRTPELPAAEPPGEWRLKGNPGLLKSPLLNEFNTVRTNSIC